MKISKKLILILFILVIVLVVSLVYFKKNNNKISTKDVFVNKETVFPPKNVITKISTVTKDSSNKKEKIIVRITIWPKKIFRIVTNGTTNTGVDPLYKNTTTYQQDGKSLDATTDNYVTVPNNTIPIGSRVYILNKNTGLDAWGIVGDIGPYGGISLHLAEQVGAWQPGMEMNLLPHILEYKYYKN